MEHNPSVVTILEVAYLFTVYSAI